MSEELSKDEFPVSVLAEMDGGEAIEWIISNMYTHSAVENEKLQSMRDLISDSVIEINDLNNLLNKAVWIMGKIKKHNNISSHDESLINQFLNEQ